MDEESTNEDIEEKYKETSQVHDEQCKLNGYKKRQILEFIKKNGHDEKSCKAFEKRFSKYKSNLITDYLNKRAQLTQEHVNEECNTSTFKRIEEWIEHFKENNYDKLCDYEISMIMKLIAETEVHPETSENEIDFAGLYDFLSDITRGNVPKQLNAASENFLMETFQDLLEKVNNEEGETQSEIMKVSFNIKKEVEDPNKKHEISKSLDPLGLK